MNELQKHPHSTQTICVSQSQLCSVFIHFHGQCLLEQYWHSRGHSAGTACTYVVTALSPSFNTSVRNFLVNFSTLKHFGPVCLSKDLCFFAQIYGGRLLDFNTSLIDEYPWHFQESTQTRKVYCEKVPKRSFHKEEEKSATNVL